MTACAAISIRFPRFSWPNPVHLSEATTIHKGLNLIMFLASSEESRLAWAFVSKTGPAASPTADFHPACSFRGHLYARRCTHHRRNYVSLAWSQAFESMRASSKRLLGGEPEEKSTLQEMEEAVCSVCPSLSWRNRLIGYGATLACGFCLSFGSLFRSDSVHPP